MSFHDAILGQKKVVANSKAYATLSTMHISQLYTITKFTYFLCVLIHYLNIIVIIIIL